jgi:hypothetical protein
MNLELRITNLEMIFFYYFNTYFNHNKIKLKRSEIILALDQENENIFIILLSHWLIMIQTFEYQCPFDG